MAVIVLTFHLTLSPASAQTEPLPLPAKGKAAGSPPKEPAPAKIISSRFVAEKDLDAYVDSTSAMFSMRDRATDPFGQPQDPNAKPVVKAAAPKAQRRIVQVQATPFSEIVASIKVTTIKPREKSFLYEGTSYKPGDHIDNLTFHGKSIRLEIVAVNSQQIVFRNLDNNETASVKSPELPHGMTRGTHGINALGMTTTRTKAPVELDPTYSPNDKTQSR